MTVLQYAVLGLGGGAVYVLVALGLVVIHRGSGVINFAQGAVGMTCTYVFWDLHDVDKIAFTWVFLIVLALAAVMGVAIQLLIMRPLRNQSPLTRMLATLGVLISLSAGVSLKYPLGTEVVNNFLPKARYSLGSIEIPASDVFLLVLSIALATVLYLVYRFTYFGLATSAVTENRSRAASLCINPDAIAAANWVIGSMLAAVAGILTAPATGLSVEGLTLLVIPALAVAVLGRFHSFPIIVGAGLVLGVLQAEIEHFGNSGSGWVAALPFFIVLVYFTLSGRRFPVKGDSSIRLPRVGSGRLRPVSIVVLAIVGIVIIETAPIPWVAGMITTGIFAIIVLSVVVVTGYAGQLSLAQFALAGCGAWVSSRLVATTGAPFVVALVVGVLAAVPIGIAVGLPALRTRGENLAVATLGMSVAAASLIFNNLSLTGGFVGTTVGNPSFLGINLSTVVKPQRYAIFVLVCLVVAGCVVANVRRSATGRRMLAIRANEAAAASLGVNVVAIKLYAFAVSAMLASLGGVLLAFESPAVSFQIYDPLTSINVLSYGVIGGVGYNGSGPIAGATLAPGAVGSNITNLFSSSIQNYLTLASGLILILILIMNPDGVARVNTELWRRLTQRARGLAHRAERPGHDVAPVLDLLSIQSANADARASRGPEALVVEGISAWFGGLRALNAVSLEVRPGQVVGLIGPNGAGKTTFIDAVTGFVPTRGGSVRLGADSLHNASPRARADQGMARTFQALELFSDLTVRENLLVASERASVLGEVRDLVWPAGPRMSSGARLAIEQFGLGAVLDRLPGELSYGQRRLVSIARALARNPSVLLLDEPAAGLSEAERDELSSLITALVAGGQVGVLLVEHDVELVMRTCSHVVALEFGEVIASAAPAQIRRDPAVIRSYLGEAPDEPGSTSESSRCEDVQSGRLT